MQGKKAAPTALSLPNDDASAHECGLRRVWNFQPLPPFDPVWWCAMNVYLSHITALRFWRAWSAAAAIPLRTFHDLGAADTSLFPDCRFSCSEVLRRCATRKEEVREILSCDGASAAGEFDSLALSALRASCLDNAGEALHVMVSPSQGTRNSSGLVRHRWASVLPKRAFVQMAPGVFVCSPEFVFAQIAPLLSFGALVALGYELCGCYPLDDARGNALVRRPLSSPRRLLSFASCLGEVAGVKQARAAAKQVLAKSASIMETEVSMVAFTSVAKGGLGIAAPKLNEPVELSARARAATGLKRVVCDWLWPAASVAVEYDGIDSHRDPRQQAHDARKRDALRMDGFDLTVITSSQFHHVSQCTPLLLDVGRRAGSRKRPPTGAQLPRHLDLRKQARLHHRAHFPQRFRKTS